MAIISKYGGSGVSNWMKYAPILHENQIESLWKQPTHDHDEIEKYWMRFGVRLSNLDAEMLNMVVKHYNGCKECASIMFEHCFTSMTPLRMNEKLQDVIVSWRKRAVRRNKNTQSHNKTFVMTCNESIMLPLLVAIKKKKTSPFRKILRHPLYTRDVWRSVLLLATYRSNKNVRLARLDSCVGQKSV
jgi:hypothetical protein